MEVTDFIIDKLFGFDTTVCPVTGGIRFFAIFRKKPLSRHHLRHDKTCLNCGTIVGERYCTHCGQENTEPKESIGHLIGHFFADITHFDSQIFTTLKDLILRPGFLTREYVAGRRVRYLNPIRMYIFISAIFFVVMFAGSEEEHKAGIGDDNTHVTNLFRQRFADSLREAGSDGVSGSAGAGADGGAAGGEAKAGDSVRKAANDEIASRLDTTEAVKAGEESMFFSFGSGGKLVIDLTENKYKTLREYDSIEPHLPDSSRNSGLWGWILRRNVQLKEEHGGRSKMHIEQNLQHSIPKIMFVLLPLFAWFVSWFYSRKKYYYVQHAIFTIHYHSFLFLLFMVVLLVTKQVDSYQAVMWVILGSYLLAYAYLVAALRGMYQQAVWLSALKALAIGLLYLVAIMGTVMTMLGLAFWRA